MMTNGNIAKFDKDIQQAIKPIVKGSIVKYTPANEQAGYYRVSAITTHWVNLAAIFHDKVYHMRVPRAEVREAHYEWYANWQESETYKSM
jgi:hypothetical protein